MRRRHVITLITGAAVAWPLGVGAQESELPVVGLLGATSEGRGLPGFRQGLSEAGFVEGRNVHSSIAGRRANTIGCRRWRPISSRAR